MVTNYYQLTVSKLVPSNFETRLLHSKIGRKIGISYNLEFGAISNLKLLNESVKWALVVRHDVVHILMLCRMNNVYVSSVAQRV